MIFTINSLQIIIERWQHEKLYSLLSNFVFLIYNVILNKHINLSCKSLENINSYIIDPLPEIIGFKYVA